MLILILNSTIKKLLQNTEFLMRKLTKAFEYFSLKELKIKNETKKKKKKLKESLFFNKHRNIFLACRQFKNMIPSVFTALGKI